MPWRERAAVAIAATIVAIGCALESPPKYPQQFDPERLLQQEFGATATSRLEMVILPEDVTSRPEVKEIITQYIARNQSDSSIAALTFINEAIDRGGGTLSRRDMSDLELIRATALYGRANFLETERSCDHAIELDSANWRAFHFRAMVRERKQDDHGFRDDMRRANELRHGRPIRQLSTKGYVI